MSLAASLQATRELLEDLASACPGTTAAAKVPAAVLELSDLDRELRAYHDTEVRLYSIANTLFGLASLDFSRRSEIRGDGSVLDGVVGCINMLGEELASYVEEHGRIERELEARVDARTHELTRANLDLTSEIVERQRAARALQQSEAELVRANLALQSEIRERQRIETELSLAQKLEAVGRLASGVAHEINTPVQFVSDSVQFVHAAFTDLAAVVARLRAVNRAVLEGEPSRAAATEARDAEADVDIDYVLAQGPLALDRALAGLAHIASIVRSMKAFAHPDAQDMSSVDLNHALESTLVMARNEYKYVADVTTELGELPLIACYPGEVNQALLNIIVNAGHAIADAMQLSGAKGRITVKTRREGEHAVIVISDTGVGIPEHIRSRIFDPFFTTKAVGRGTGQGLSVVRSVIVDRHAGAVKVDSVVGQGTTFEIRLPIEAHARRAAG